MECYKCDQVCVAENDSRLSITFVRTELLFSKQGENMQKILSLLLFSILIVTGTPSLATDAGRTKYTCVPSVDRVNDLHVQKLELSLSDEIHFANMVLLYSKQNRPITGDLDYRYFSGNYFLTPQEIGKGTVSVMLYSTDEKWFATVTDSQKSERSVLVCDKSHSSHF